MYNIKKSYTLYIVRINKIQYYYDVDVCTSMYAEKDRERETSVFYVYDYKTLFIYIICTRTKSLYHSLHALV